SNAQDITYKVQSGDTFWIISQKYDVDIYKLMATNNANENTVLYVGQNLVIPSSVDAQKIHTVQAGETYWIISEKYGVNIHELMRINNASEKTMLNIGDKLVIPSEATEKVHIVQSGETYWIISQKYGVDVKVLLAYNGANENTVLYVGQSAKIPVGNMAPTITNNTVLQPQTNTVTKPYITYDSYTVQSGDNWWNLSIKFGIPQSELLKANNMSESTNLNIGDALKIPVHNIPIKDTPGEQYGEYLDWWTEAQYVIPVNAEFKVVDFYTGKSFMAKRTTGANHADVETLTIADTNAMKEIWGGSFSWDRRPAIIEYKGRTLAVSVASMPHAGNDSAPGGQYTAWRSDNYGSGYNLDWVKNNGIDGVFDIHFANSTRHSDGQVDTKHQENIKIAAGIK
ncbi:LysM peptidoglycan-binding domain-containing protein, partial [Anaerosolibacter sp.]|uniref:LysM peptidoglycan-binding domain-containing protein n=1 Tax=Anaerosolibacter sp. TaxID=1872527 RepID=UPI0039EF13C7